MIFILFILHFSLSFSQDAQATAPAEAGAATIQASPPVDDKSTSDASGAPKDNFSKEQKMELLVPVFTYGEMYTQCGNVLKPQGADAPPAKVSSNATYDKFQHLIELEKCVSEKFNETIAAHNEKLCGGKNKLECTFYFFYGKVRTAKGIANVMSNIRFALLPANGAPSTVTKVDVDYRMLDYIDSLMPSKLFLVQAIAENENDKKRFAAHAKSEISELKYNVIVNLNIIDSDLRSLNAAKIGPIHAKLVERSSALRKKNWDQ